jgi:hypothetical protein
MKYIKCETTEFNDKIIVDAAPATGVLYITKNTPEFISGHVRVRGKNEGRYPYNILEMIDRVFGPDDNTIEVCSCSVEGVALAVDKSMKTKATRIDDGQYLHSVPSNTFTRWRCDPPYNENTSAIMYGTNLPSTGKLLTAGARVCKVGALMFLLLGPQNYQYCPSGVKRIGLIYLSVVPNNETRALNIFVKESNSEIEPLF